MIFIIVRVTRHRQAASSPPSPSRRRSGLMRKQRVFFAPNAVLVAVSLAALIAAANVVKSCPLVCACKWKGGKRKVECANKNLTALLSDIDVETQVLDFSKNLLVTLDDRAFEKINLLNLQKLYVSDCGVVAIHQRAFDGLTNLVELDLSENALSSIPSSSLRAIPALMRLILAANPIRTVAEAAFAPLKYLTTLDLSDCRIENIDTNAFDGLTKLEWLRLDGNRLKSVPNELSLPSSVIGGLSLHRNPWTCDCHLRTFRRWLERAKRLVAEPVCVEPPQYRDMPVSRLQPQDLACAPYVVPSSLFVEIEQGKNISFVCRVTAVPEARITWEFEGAPVAAVYNASTEQQTAFGLDQISELFVFEAKLSDNGTYRCVAENVAGLSASNYTLRVIVLDKNVPELSDESYSQALASSAFTLLLVVLATIFLVSFCFIIYAAKNTSTDKRTMRRRLNGASKRDNKLAANVRYEIVCKQSSKSKDTTAGVSSTSNPNSYLIINNAKGKRLEGESLLFVPGVLDGGRLKQTNLVDTVYVENGKMTDNAARTGDCTITTTTGTVKLYLTPNSTTTSGSYYDNLYVNPFEGYVAANPIDSWMFQLQAPSGETNALRQNTRIFVDSRDDVRSIEPIENGTINFRYNLEGYPYPSKLKLELPLSDDDDGTEATCAEKPNKTPILSPPDPFKTINSQETAVKS